MFTSALAPATVSIGQNGELVKTRNGEATVIGTPDDRIVAPYLVGVGEPFTLVNGAWIPSAQVRAYARAWDRAQDNRGHVAPTFRPYYGPITVKQMTKKMQRQMMRAAAVKGEQDRYAR